MNSVRKEGCASISELTLEERENVDENVGNLVVCLNTRCLSGRLDSIKRVAPQSNGTVPDQPYLVLHFDKSNDGSLSKSERSVRKSLKIHSGDKCRLARFKLSQSVEPGEFTAYEFCGYTPYVGEHSPRYNPYTSKTDEKVRCEWVKCHCETKLNGAVVKTLKYALVLTPL